MAGIVLPLRPGSANTMRIRCEYSANTIFSCTAIVLPLRSPPSDCTNLPAYHHETSIRDISWVRNGLCLMAHRAQGSIQGLLYCQLYCHYDRGVPVRCEYDCQLYCNADITVCQLYFSCTAIVLQYNCDCTANVSAIVLPIVLPLRSPPSGGSEVCRTLANRRRNSKVPQ